MDNKKYWKSNYILKNWLENNKNILTQLNIDHFYTNK